MARAGGHVEGSEDYRRIFIYMCVWLGEILAGGSDNTVATLDEDCQP